MLRWLPLSLLVVSSASAQDVPLPRFLSVETARPRSEGVPDMDGEPSRFTASARAYRATVDSLLQRDMRRRRVSMHLRWQTRIEREAAANVAARGRAIEAFESFLQRHPDDRRFTPEAMLRLAELYEARDDARGEDRCTRSAPLYATIRRRFPSYRRRRVVSYLHGLCLEEAHPGDAVAAWESVVCPQGRWSSCPPPEDALGAEVWFRLGEYAFDAGSLDDALVAYGHVPESHRLHALARYKRAWTYFRTERHPEALEAFLGVVEGGAHLLHDEALTYAALILVDGDSGARGSGVRGSGARGSAGGGPTAAERLAHLRTGPWSPALYARVGRILADDALEEDALALWRRGLERFPNAANVPEVYREIARVHDRRGEHAEALDALEAFARQPGEREGRSEAAYRVALERHRMAQRSAGDRDAYEAAVRAYREVITRHHPRRAELELHLGDALMVLGRHAEAAEAYRAARDGGLAPRTRADAGRRVVAALSALAPEVPEASPTPVEVDARLDAVAVARARYLQLPVDPYGLRAAYAYNNGALLYRHGFLEHAAPRLERSFEESCGSSAEVARLAWQTRFAMAREPEERDRWVVRGMRCADVVEEASAARTRLALGRTLRRLRESTTAERASAAEAALR